MHTSMMTVNSPPVSHRDITGSAASYRPYNEEYTAVQQNTDRPIHVEMEERTKKDKKWSIGKLFRRKKKEDDSGSSSQSDEAVSGKSPSKKKNKKKKRPPAVNNFDHIVIRDTRRAQSLAKPHVRELQDDGILSDPSAGLINYKTKIYDMYDSKDFLDLKHDSHLGSVILETPTKKKRKSRLKARVEALRNSIRGDSSSDEESLKSSNSSSINRFRSEDSLMRSRDSSLNKKSRTARNERYIKRLSRDEENQLNKEAELLQQGYTKAEVEMLTRTPTSQSSGYGTCKRDNVNNIKSDQLNINEPKRVPLKSESISSFPSAQSYLSSINFNAKVNDDHINYTIKCPSNNFIKEPHINSNREESISNQYESPESIMCVKFPLGNITHSNQEDKSPPVPPPRDMQRKVTTPISMCYDNNSLLTDRITNHKNITHGVPNNDFERIMRRSQERTTGHGLNGLRRPISNSEDHIAIQNNEYTQYYPMRNDQPRRPASVSAEPNYYSILGNNTPWRKKNDDLNVAKPEPVQLRQDYLYYADQSPRSRRPISIKTSQNSFSNQYVSDYQTPAIDTSYKRPKNASEFWKKIDDAERQRRQQSVFANSRSNSDNISSMDMTYKAMSDQNRHLNKALQSRAESVDSYNRNKSFDVIDGAKMWKATTEYKRSTNIEPTKNIKSPTKTHVRHKSDTFIPTAYQMTSDEEKSSERRKSTNLDDALNELEAIYNSLGLGDEDLLDRAERRELMTPKFNDHFNDWNGNDDEIQLRSQPTTPLRRISRRSTLPDKLQDDMAFRRLNSFSNKEKPKDLKETQSQISYMLASPIYVPYASDDDRHSERNEPDVVYDDVVYRNIKQTNSRLKTIDPQPPFGIPVGPISPAPQSDYLHAIPENKGRSRFVPKRTPDLVTDDLAYRSLRKDNRSSSVFGNDEYIGYINNNSYNEYPQIKESIANIKKKRAIRSLSANIFSMIQKEIDEAINASKPTLQKTNSNNDMMKRLRETFENNDNNLRDHHPRNKVKYRHNTVNLFVNNTHAPLHPFTKDDSFIHTDDTCFAKTSSCDKSKSSSPSTKSPQISKRSSKDEFQHVLSMLAQEAMDTSNKLGVALAELDRNRNKNETTEVRPKMDESRIPFLNAMIDKSINNNKLEVNKSDSATVNCQVNDEYEKEPKINKTEESLYVISDQLHKAEDELKQSFHKGSKAENNEIIFSELTDTVNESRPANEKLFCSSNITLNNTVQESFTDSLKKVECTNSNKYETQSQRKNLNPFLNNDETVKELNEIKAFKELKDGISDLIAGISEVNDKLFLNKNSDNSGNIPINIDENVTQASEKLAEVTQCKLSHNPKRTSANLSIYENNIEPKKDGADSTEYNSSEELATIFKFEANVKSTESMDDTEKNPREDLSSPKLVQTVSQNLRRHSVDEGTSSQNNTLPNNVIPWRVKKQSHNSQNDSKGEK